MAPSPYSPPQTRGMWLGGWDKPTAMKSSALDSSNQLCHLGHLQWPWVWLPVSHLGKCTENICPTTMAECPPVEVQTDSKMHSLSSCFLAYPRAWYPRPT